jgi:glycosyltransferase involved in cell wall biosynthesis
VLGSFWEQLIVNAFPKCRGKVTILPNATKPHSRKSPDKNGNPLHICFLGLLGARKGTFDLIRALERLSSYQNWYATIAGNGEVERCHELTNSLGLGNRIKIPGWLDPASVDSLLSKSDIFVLPSTAENLPMAILEAFSYGLAVIATPVGAVREVIEDGRNGLLIPVGDVAALADSLRLLLDSADTRTRIGKAAHMDHANRYNIDVYASQLATIWHDATKSNLIEVKTDAQML